MAGRLEGKVAIVTGAGRGIGRGEALALAAEGAAVVVNDLGCNTDGSGIDASPADEVVALIRANGGRAVANAGNVAVHEDGEALVRQALDEFGRLDIVVNNAGVLRDRMIFNMTEDDWDTVIDVHLKGHFNVIRPACVLFRQQRSGRIINTASESGLGNLGQANYAAAKEGIVGLSRTVARDMSKYGVTCNAIRPRAGTRMTVSPEMAAAAAKRAATEAAGGDAGEGDGEASGIAKLNPDFVAPLVVFLASDAAAGVNGYDFVVFGNQISLMSQPQPIQTIWSTGPSWTVDALFERFPSTLGRHTPPVPLFVV